MKSFRSKDVESQLGSHTVTQRGLRRRKVMILHALTALTSGLYLLWWSIALLQPHSDAVPVKTHTNNLKGFSNLAHVHFAADPHRKGKDIFEVSHPVPERYGQAVASQLFLQHEFGNSWNDPFKTNYTPPGVDFTHVTLTLNASVEGNQFDRLGHIFLGGVEIWRPSTAEPSGGYVTFSFIKDVSDYTSLFKSNRQVAYLLNNVIDKTYTGVIKIEITADFYNVEQQPVANNDLAGSYQVDRYPDSVVPLSTKKGPGQLHKLPNDKMEVKADPVSSNTTRAVVDVFASGDAEEEFWYSHLLDKYNNDYGGEFGGRGPSRIVEVYIDGMYAGFAYPYPVIYTGGMTPAFWSPIVGIRAYQVPSYHVDVTPFLARLYAGCKIKFRVSNGLDQKDPQTDDDWLVTASLMTWQITGANGSAVDPALTHTPQRTTMSFMSPDKKSLMQVVATNEKATSSARLQFGQQSLTYSWTQSGKLSNVQNIDKYGDDQSTVQGISGMALATVDDLKVERFEYTYGTVASSWLIGDHDDSGYNMSVTQGYSTQNTHTNITTGLTANAYSRINGHNYLGGNGTTEQRYKSSVYGEEYERHVKATGGNVVLDHASVGNNGRADPTVVVPLIEETVDLLLQKPNATDALTTADGLYLALLGPHADRF